MAVVRALTGLVLLCSLGAGSGLAQAQSPASAQQAADFVRDASNRAMVLVAQQDRAHLSDLIQQTFDFDDIGRFVLGRSWQSATPEQRTEYQQLFVAATTETYAERLAAEKGASLTVQGARPAPDAAEYLVRAAVHRPSGESMDLDLRVRDGVGGMRIVDVLAGGVSMERTQRSDFASVIRREGFDGLLAQLKARSGAIQAAAAGTQ